MSDEKIYIKLLKTGNNLGAFKVTADNYTTPTVSLISPNEATSGYDVSKTSFVVGSTQLDDTTNPDNDVRMLFDKVKGAFRAGTETGDQWDSANRGTNSTALGNNNKASGLESVAIGGSNLSTMQSSVTIGNANAATGIRSIAIGTGNVASAQSSLILGDGCAASAADAVAIGQAVTASGINATAIGKWCTASGQNSFAIGYGTDTSTNANKASGTGSVAIGYMNDVSGTNSVAVGYTNIASTSNSVAIGFGCESSSSKSVSIGNQCVSNADNAISIGTFSNATGMNSFAIGYGTGSIAPNANIAAGTGSVAIGNINNVTGTNSVAIGRSNTIVAGANNSYAIGQGCSITSANATESIVMGTNAIMGSSNNSRCFFWNGDSSTRTMPAVPTGSACFSCGGDPSSVFAITFAGSTFTATSSATGYAWSSSSSIDLKENLVEHTYSDTLDKIMEMPIYTYNFKTVAPGIKSIGPVAQDFNRLFPSDKDQLSIVERDMCGVALAGVKGVKLGLDSLSTTTTNTSSAQQSQINTLIESLATANTQITTLSVSLTSAIVRITALESEAVTLKSKVDKLEKDKK